MLSHRCSAAVAKNELGREGTTLPAAEKLPHDRLCIASQVVYTASRFLRVSSSTEPPSPLSEASVRLR